MQKISTAHKTVAIVLLTGFFLFSGALLYAAQDTFTTTLSVTGTTDTTPPSVPSSLSATAVSTSQINLSWTASTDDVAVLAYKIYRDTVHIATSTGTTYGDTGLSEGTTYAYTVSAVDTSYNESLQSATASATTETSIVTPPSSPGGNGPPSLFTQLAIVNLKVVPALYSTTITWDTTKPAISRLAWGLSSEYEMGTLSGTSLKYNHKTNIENLSPGTTYFFELEARDATGLKTGVTRMEWKTLSLPDTAPPANVSNFTARPQDGAIFLDWNNPADPDFDFVRIVRSNRFYPRDPQDGEVVYEERGERAEDSDVVAGQTYYYTAFARDTDGNYSSGAVVSARITAEGGVSLPPELPFDGFPPSPDSYPEFEKLTILDFDFIQDGKKLVFSNETAVLDGTKNLIISLDYRKVPEVLKTIGITLQDPADPEKVFAFLLRVNSDKSAYEAVIAPLQRSGTYHFGIAILDFKNQSVKKLSGSLVARVPFDPYTGNTVADRRKYLLNSFSIALLALIVLALLIAIRKLFARGRDRRPRRLPQEAIPQKIRN
ncbi:MAG: hypothetical protein AAB523_01390 [Patescibacteria group bacterium]